MSSIDPTLPKPRRRLLRTFFKRPRNLRRFAPRISYEEAAQELPSLEEAGHWGQVALLNDAVVALHRDGTISRLWHFVTLLAGDQELSEWDEINRNYNRKRARQTIKTAEVYLPDGTRRRAEQTTAALDGETQIISLLFSPLRPGVLLEFEEQYDEFVYDDIGPCVWDQMYLQSSAPCRRLRFTVAIAPPFEADFRLHHCDWQPEISEEQGYRVYRWDLENTAGVELDQWTPHPRDFAPWVDISTLKSWKPVAKRYQKELQPSEIVPDSVKKLAGELTEDASTPREQVSAVYRYAARDMRYGRHPRELMVETPREAGKMLEDLRGDCKDKSSLLVAMLSELDIPAKIALLLTRVNGEKPFLPAPRFDHAIVFVELDGETLWLDAAGGPYTFGDIPYNDQGVNALILDGDDSRMLEIPSPTSKEHRIERTCRGSLANDGTYRFDARVTMKGEPAVGMRIQYQDRREDHRRRMLAQSVAGELTGAEVGEAEFLALDDLTRDVSFRYSITLNQWARRVEDILLFRIPWSEPILTTGPISAAERVQPLAVPQVVGIRERHEIEVPEGFTGYGLPYLTERNCGWLSYSCSVRIEDDRLICEHRIDHRGGIVLPEQFSEFKRFWEECARAEAADVVLMKAGRSLPVQPAGLESEG